jgi:ATP-dependent DNA helicase RecG
MDTRSLISGGETLTTEFKSHLNDRDLTKAVACLANAQGGTLLLGVDDTGRVVGAQPRPSGHMDPGRVAAYIQNSTDPPLGVAVSLDDLDGKSVFRVDVPVAMPGHIATKDGYYTKRVLDTLGQPQCVPMSPQEIVSMGMVTRGQDFAASAAVGATFADLDPAEFDRYRRLCHLTGDGTAELQDEDILRALGLVPIGGTISLGAILLFGKSAAVSRWVPNAEFIFQDLRRGENAANERIVGPLLGVAEAMRALIDARNRVTELLAGMHRVEISLIPSVTRREALANAIVHRDYSALGPTRVQIDDAEFVVSNPGGLPPGVTIHNILDESRPRSPILADAFKRAGLVERKGKGVNEMFEQQLRAGRDAPSYARSTTDSVLVSVPLGTADLDLVRFLLTFENEQQRSLGLDQLRVVHEIKGIGSAAPNELAESLSMLPATVRNIATQLVELGIVESRGTGRSRRLHLTPRFYDLAQDRSAYVRVKGADPIQQERMIRDYVDAYGSITRGQAAALCQLSPTQARGVLKRMVDHDQLRLVGERRGAKYVRV